MKSVLLILASLVIFSACTKDKVERYPVVPEIEYIGVSSRQVHFRDTDMAFSISFWLRDGDGDIGRGSGLDSAIIYEDIRSDTVFQRIKLQYPTIPDEYFKDGQLYANTTFQVPAAVITPRLDTFHVQVLKDTMIGRIYVIDDAGNQSNIIETPPIYIGE